MTNFDIIGTLRTYAVAKGWVFLSGASWYQNYELSQATLTAGKIILAVDFDASPIIKNNKILQVKYNGLMMLGEKTETTGTAESSFDETYIQKYDARLLALMTLLASTIGDVACTNELDIDSLNFKVGLNKFDENADFVIATVNFTS
jgi:hypothetical protein